MKTEDKLAPFLWAIVVVALIALLLTVSELQRYWRIVEQAQIHVDTIHRGTVLAQEFCEKQVEGAKCKPL